MPRTPQAGINRDARVTVRFTPRETAKMDERRGQQARSSYIRALVKRDTEENDA
jgi:hypothetical protein